MKTKTIYEAVNGRPFDTEEACEKYEIFLDNREVIRETINNFFKDVNNYDYVTPGKWTPYYCPSIDENFKLIILDYEGGPELYEDFNIDEMAMENLEIELNKRYGIEPNYPANYWGK